MINIDDLYFAHPGRKDLFSGLTLHISRGDSILLKGANGSGKSTLLKLLAGILKARQGKITIAGREVKGLSSDIFNSVFYQSQITTENLLGINPMHDWEIWQMALPQLPPLENEDIMLFSEMSSGMLKRHSQRILPHLMDKFWMLDEPFTFLDDNAAGELWQLLRKKSMMNTGMLIVSHDTPPDEFIFNRTLEISKGDLTEASL